MAFRRRRKTRKEKEMLGLDLANHDDDDDGGLAGFLQDAARFACLCCNSLESIVRW